MSQQFRLGKLDAAFVPVDLERVESGHCSRQNSEQILKQWQGSRQFLVLDWVPTRDTLTQIDVDDHLEYVRRTSRVLKQLLAAYAEQIQESSPEAQLDLLFYGHGAGYEINRETVNRLNVSDVADAFDYVKFVTLDPYPAVAQRSPGITRNDQHGRSSRQHLSDHRGRQFDLGGSRCSTHRI